MNPVFIMQHFANSDIPRLSWCQPRLCSRMRMRSGGGGRFVGDLRLEYIDGRNWRLLEDFTYVTADGEVTTAPAGFVMDFASVPRIFWSILPPTGDYGPAAVIHDVIYRTGKYPRGRADAIFLEAMQTSRVVVWKRWVMYSAVRAFGWKAYNKFNGAGDGK